MHQYRPANRDSQSTAATSIHQTEWMVHLQSALPLPEWLLLSECCTIQVDGLKPHVSLPASRTENGSSGDKATIPLRVALQQSNLLVSVVDPMTGVDLRRWHPEEQCWCAEAIRLCMYSPLLPSSLSRLHPVTSTWSLKTTLFSSQ